MEKSIQSPHLRMILDSRRLPKEGLHIALDADRQDLTELVERFELPRIFSLSAQIDIEEINPIRLKGRIKASFEQACVVSLELFEQKMDISFQTFFVLPEMQSIVSDVVVEPDEDDVEILENGRIDLKSLIFDYFGLHLDPFPKKDVAAFFEYREEPSEEEKKAENPFSVLKKLTKS